MAGELTVSERILFHLNNYIRYEDKFESPFDVTQDGISQACSISRAHAAIEIKKMRAAGIVEERLSHVRRGKARRKVYFLTFEGKARAANVVQYVRDNGIVPNVDATRVSPELVSPRVRSAKRSCPLPSVKEFYGRDQDLSMARRALSLPDVRVLSITGIAGIGKTAFAAKLASELSGHRVFWYSAKPWDTNRNLADALAKFFSDNGNRKLSAYLASGKFELGELSFLLDEELGGNGYAFVFDDADAFEGLQEFLRVLKHSCGAAKIIVTSEAPPKFYERSDVVARKEVFEIELGGLEMKAALQLLSARGISGPIAEELVKTTHGHPLSLEMVTDVSPAEARHQVARFFEEKFYSALAEEEKSLLQLASVFRKPFPSDAIPKELRQAKKGSMLREVAPGRFEIHASLRSFVYDSLSSEDRAMWHSVAADHYLRAGDPQERLFHLLRANRSLEAEMMMARLGEDLLAHGNVQRLWEILSFFEPSKPKYRQAVMLLKARAASLVGEYDKAWSILGSVSAEGESRFRAEALVEMGEIKSERGELEEASRLFLAGLEQAEGLPCERAKALRGLGVVEGKLGNYSRAQEFLERSARDAMAAMNSRGMLLAHLELGNVFICRGMYEEAIDHFSKCAAGFGPVELTSVHMNMGIANARLGRVDEAKVHLENAIRLADETGQPRSRARVLTSLAEVLIRLGQTETAKEHCFRALDIVTELGDRLVASAAYADLGMAERASGNLSASEEYYAESLAALEGVDSPLMSGERKMALGQLLVEKGEAERGREMLLESAELFRSVDAKDMLSAAEEALRKLPSDGK